MKKYSKLLLILPLFAIACSSSDDSTTAAPSEVSNSVTTINGKLSAVSDMIGGTPSASAASRENSVEQRAGFGADWTDDGAVGSLYNNSTVSIQQWFIDEFDENFVNESSGAKVTFAGRVSNTVDILCYLGLGGLPTDSTNLPTAGSHTLTLTTAMVTACGGEDEMVGASVTLVVTATTDDTYYDKKIAITMSEEEADCPQVYYARMNSAAINLASAEDQNCQGRDHVSKSVFHFNKSTEVTTFVYISKAFTHDDPTGYEIYRGYLNEDTDVAYVVGFYGGDDDGDSTFESGISFTAAGKPSAGGTIALSATLINPPGAVAGTYDACVNSDDVSLDSDNDLSCTLTGQDSSATHTAVVEGQYDAAANDSLAKIYGIGETTTPGFTNSTNIFQ